MSFSAKLKQKLADMLDLGVNANTSEFYVPTLTTAADQGIKCISVDFPTGDLLVCDWPQLGKLNKHLEKAIEEQYFNLNTAQGCDEQTRFIAQAFGFVSLFVGNSDPAIFANEDTILIGHRPYDDASGEPVADDSSPYREVASVSTSMWWATLVDMGTLRTLANKYLPSEQVDALLQDVRQNTAQHSFITAPQGTYNIYYDNNHDDLWAAVAGTEFDVKNVSKSYGIITQKNLDHVFRLNAQSVSP